MGRSIRALSDTGILDSHDDSAGKDADTDAIDCRNENRKRLES